MTTSAHFIGKQGSLTREIGPASLLAGGESTLEYRLILGHDPRIGIAAAMVVSR